MQDNTILRKQMRLLLKEKQWSLYKFSQISGIKYDQLRAFMERKNYFPRLLTISRIADCFLVSIDWLLGRTEVRQIRGLSYPLDLEENEYPENLGSAGVYRKFVRK